MCNVCYFGKGDTFRKGCFSAKEILFAKVVFLAKEILFAKVVFSVFCSSCFVGAALLHRCRCCLRQRELAHRLTETTTASQGDSRPQNGSGVFTVFLKPHPLHPYFLENIRFNSCSQNLHPCTTKKMLQHTFLCIAAYS